MGRIFRGQTALRITVKTFCDLDGVDKAVIKFRKPDGSGGELEALIGKVDTSVIYHEVKEGELDATGWWGFWAFVTYPDGRTAIGETAKVFIWDEG